MPTILRCIQYGDDYVELTKLEDASYVVESYKGKQRIARETTTGYDDAMIHYLTLSKAAKKRNQEA